MGPEGAVVGAVRGVLAHPPTKLTEDHRRDPFVVAAFAKISTKQR